MRADTRQLAAQRDTLKALRPALERHSGALEATHPSGKVFVRELFGAVDDLLQLLSGADTGLLDAALAEPAPEEIAAQSAEHLAYMTARVGLIEALEEEDAEAIRTMRRRFAPPAHAGRVHLICALKGACDASMLYAAVLRRYGVEQDTLQRARRLHDTLTALTAATPGAPPLAALIRIAAAADRADDRVHKARVVATLAGLPPL